MRSFTLAIEPAAEPRLAAWILLLHAAAATSPWLAHCPPVLAVLVSALAAAGFCCNLARVPGSHCRLQALALDDGGCRVRLAGDARWLPAELGSATRAYADCVLLEVRVAGRRQGWLLRRRALSPAMFRRLKARIRLLESAG
jgi:hypothetical protein